MVLLDVVDYCIEMVWRWRGRLSGSWEGVRIIITRKL